MKHITIIVIFISSILFSQQTVKTGNLLKLNFHAQEIDYTDTLWHWVKFLL